MFADFFLKFCMQAVESVRVPLANSENGFWNCITRFMVYVVLAIYTYVLFVFMCPVCMPLSMFTSGF